MGKNGSTKSEIERLCGVELKIDSRTGDVMVLLKGPLEDSNPLKALDLVTAITRGFSPQRAMRLMGEEEVLEVIDLREYAGKSENSLSRIKGRLIGLNGRSRRVIEELTGADLSIYGHTLAILGRPDQTHLAARAVGMLASGSPHKAVYEMLQKARTQAKLERLRLWEGEPIV